MSIDLQNLTIVDAHAHLTAGDFSVQQLVDAVTSNINAKNDELNVYLEVFSDIDDQVARAQKMIDDGTATVLTGIPAALKANLLRKGHIASASSEILSTYKATYTATVVEKLEQAGVVFMGVANMDEFAMGSSTENSAFGVTRNPHDPNRVPGGSSGGSAAAVAADMALFALGTDTGGSIRQPAAFCGTVGLKTTYGGVSRYGAIAMGSSLDQIGPFSKTAADAELIWEFLKGHDKHDMTTLPDSTWEKTENKDSYNIAIPQDFVGNLDTGVKELFEASIAKLESAGHKISYIDIPSLAYALPVYYVVMPAEVSSNLARYDGVRYGKKVEGKNLVDEYIQTKSIGYGSETKRRIILGTYILQAGYTDDYYARALAVKEKLKQDLAKVHEEHDFVLTPTTPSPAFKIGEKSDDPLAMYLADIFTVAANIAGTPAISVPAGTSSVDGIDLPVGIQFMGAYGSDRAVLDIAKKFEKID